MIFHDILNLFGEELGPTVSKFGKSLPKRKPKKDRNKNKMAKKSRRKNRR